MEVEFRFTKKMAQISLIPSDSIDDQELTLIRSFGDKSVKTRLGAGKEFIIEFGSNGDTQKRADLVQPPQDDMSSRTPVRG
jgi:hypothetical protein